MATATVSPPSSSGALGFLNAWWRLGGVAGLAFIVLFFTGIALFADAPTYTDDVADIRAYFVDNGDRYLVGDWLMGIAIVFLFIPFASALRNILGAVDPSDGMWARTSFIGAVLFAVLGAVGSIAWGALAFGETAGLDDSSVHALMHIDAYAFAAVPLGTGLFLAAASVVIVQTGVLWRWLGYVGPIIALLGVIGGLWVVDGNEDGFLAFLSYGSLVLTALWVIAVSVAMIMHKMPPEAT